VATTWGPNPLSPNYFVKQPLTVEDAKKNGFEQVSTGCGGELTYSIVFLSNRKILYRKISWTTLHKR
jgi:hypothetical protein